MKRFDVVVRKGQTYGHHDKPENPVIVLDMYPTTWFTSHQINRFGPDGNPITWVYNLVEEFEVAREATDQELTELDRDYRNPIGTALSIKQASTT